MFKKTRGLTLIELMVSLAIMSLVIIGIYNIQSFSINQAVDAERRAKVQNDLAYIFEHMSKYVQQANGNINNRPIVMTATGFQVRFDCKAVQTPANLADDVWIYYSLSGHNLSTGCNGAGCAACPAGSVPVPPEVLSNKILANFQPNTIMPAAPADGFYVKIDPLGNLVDVGLAGRYLPDPTTSLLNPQVQMKMKLICNSSSAN
jgi:prepilin-type N-terminal cleavage/methylation domain-containing protein